MDNAYRLLNCLKLSAKLLRNASLHQTLNMSVSEWSKRQGGSDRSDNDCFYGQADAKLSSVLKSEPWKKEPEYFRSVCISTLALAKMAIHAQRGKSEEIMGILTGRIMEGTFIVLDCYGLPVEATETRVNAMGEAYEYMVQYIENQQSLGISDNIVVWYHSHPGYGCWLSGIDVTTQQQNQAYQDPFLAIVIDPFRTNTSGKIDIGAFRTLPEGIKKQGVVDDSSLTKYGAHAHRYYPLDVSYFGTSLDEPVFDLVWNRYWTSVLAETYANSDRDYSISKLVDANTRLLHLGKLDLDTRSHMKSEKLLGISRDLSHQATNDIGGLIGQKCRDVLFK